MADCVDFWGEGGTMGCPGPQGIQGPAGPAGPKGSVVSDFQVLRSLSAVVSTGSFQAKIDSTVNTEGGLYYVFWTCRYNGSNQLTEYEIRVEINGNEVDALPAEPVGMTDNTLTWSSFDLVQLPSALSSFKVEHRTPGGAGTLTVSAFKLGYFKVAGSIGAPD